MKKVLILVVLIFSLTGCAQNAKGTPAVVTEVQICCRHIGVEHCRRFTDDGDVRTVLNCLRMQRSKGRALVDPERVMGDSLKITVLLSDGQVHIYRHRGGRFLSKDGRAWQRVDPESIYMLYDLLWMDV